MSKDIELKLIVREKFLGEAKASTDMLMEDPDDETANAAIDANLVVEDDGGEHSENS